MDKLKFGFGECKITPHPFETMMDGYGHRMMPNEGIRTDVYAKFSVLETEKERLYFVALDICYLDQALMDLLNEHFYYHLKIDVSKIVYCATHTHTGPISGAILDQGRNLIYWHRMAERMAKTLKGVIDNLEEGTLEIKTCDKELYYIYNRMGREEVDRRVLLAVFKNLKGEIKGVLANASCHCTCLGDDLISGDYPGKMTELMAKEYPNIPIVFLQGRGGDTNPNRPLVPNDNVKLFETLGTEFYEVISDGLKNLKGEVEKEFDLKSIRKTINVPCAELNTVDYYENKLFEEYEHMYNEPTDVKKRWVLGEIYYNKACKEYVLKGLKSEVTAEIQLFKINDKTIFAFLPFELLCQTGNLIEQELLKLGYEYGKIFVIGYSNVVKTYLPPRKYYDKKGYDIKGYDSATHWAGRPEYAENAEDVVIEETIKLAKQL